MRTSHPVVLWIAVGAGLLSTFGACTFSASTAATTADTLVVAIESDPHHLDPRVGSDKMSYNFHRILYCGLIQRDREDRLIADLAIRWERRSDRVWIFRLRPDVQFHNGKPVTAYDVVYTYRSLLEGRITSPKRGAFSDLDQVEALDRYTVRFRLKRPNASFLINLTLGIVPEGYDVDAQHPPIGSGPFRWVAGERSRFYIMERNDKFHGPRPKVRRLIYKVIPDMTVRWLELRRGTVDLAINNLSPDLLREVNRYPNLGSLQAPSSSVAYLALNLRHPILRHRRVREALAHALDLADIRRYLFHGAAVPALSLLHPLHWAYHPGGPPLDYDPEAARRLLDQAGFRDPDGPGPLPRFRLTLKTSTALPSRLEIAQVFQYQLRKVGIDLRIQPLEWGTFYHDITSGNFEIYSLAWVGVSDPDIYTWAFHSRFVPPNGANRVYYHNPEVDELLEQARQTYDLQQRKEIYARVQEQIYRDLPYILLWYEPNIAVMQRNVKGFEFYPNADYYALVKTFKDSVRN